MSVPLTLTLPSLLEREPSHSYDLKRDYGACFGWASSLTGVEP